MEETDLPNPVISFHYGTVQETFSSTFGNPFEIEIAKSHKRKWREKDEPNSYYITEVIVRDKDFIDWLSSTINTINLQFSKKIKHYHAYGGTKSPSSKGVYIHFRSKQKLDETAGICIITKIAIFSTRETKKWHSTDHLWIFVEPYVGDKVPEIKKF